MLGITITTELDLAMGRIRAHEAKLGKTINVDNLIPRSFFPELLDQIAASSQFRGEQLTAWSAGSGFGFTPEHLAIGIIKCVKDNVNLADISRIIEDVFKGIGQSGTHYCPIFGVSVNEKCDFSNGFGVIPYAHVPQSENKSMFERFYDRRKQFMHPIKMPGSAIEQKVFHKGVLKKQSENPFTESMIKIDDVKNIINTITCFTLRPIYQYECWFSFDDPIVDKIFNSKCLSGPSVPSLTFLDDISVGKEVMLEAKNLYLLLSGNKKLRIPIDRLSRSCNRSDIEDAIIDLAIAYESIFMDGSGAHSFKLSTRSARYLGKSSNERREIKRDVAKLYDSRSKLVHSGSSVNEETYKMKSRCQGHMTGIMSRIVSEGKMPDFEELDLT